MSSTVPQPHITAAALPAALPGARPAPSCHPACPRPREPQEPVGRWPATCSGQPGRQGPPVPCWSRDPAIPGASSGVPPPGGCALGPPPFKCCFRSPGSVWDTCAGARLVQHSDDVIRACAASYTDPMHWRCHAAGWCVCSAMFPAAPFEVPLALHMLHGTWWRAAPCCSKHGHGSLAITFCLQFP